MKSFDKFIEYYLETIQITPAFEVFIGSMSDFSKLLENKVSAGTQAPYYRMIYAGVIGALESYLYDTFVKLVLENEEIKLTTLKNKKIFDKKYTLDEFAKKGFSIDEEIVKKLSVILWHNIEKARNLFKHAANIEFPEVDNELRKAILARHDIVHRNGKHIHGEDVLISFSDVKELISKVELFVYSINKQILALCKNNGSA